MNLTTFTSVSLLCSPPPFISFPPNNPCIFFPPPPPPSPHSKSNLIFKKLSDRLAYVLGYVATISIVGIAKSCNKRIKKLVTNV
jgi:hypothetical protein